jgi:hypothetical protein
MVEEEKRTEPDPLPGEEREPQSGSDEEQSRETTPERREPGPGEAEQPTRPVTVAEPAMVRETVPAPQPVLVGEPAKEVKTGGRRVKIALAVIAIVAILAVAAFATLTVTMTPVSASASYPYKVTYDVLFPAGKEVRIGNVDIIAIPFADKVSLYVNQQAEELEVGETRDLSAKHASISTLGTPMMEFDFKIIGTYRGMVGSRADFYLEFQTSRQVPTFLIDRLLPGEVEARPV